MLLLAVLLTAAAPAPLAVDAPVAAELAPVAVLPPPPPPPPAPPPPAAAAAAATAAVGPTPVMKRWKISKFFPIIPSSPEQQLGEWVSNQGSNMTLAHLFFGGRDRGALGNG